jgi:HCOMODA/2-hydroxy-3-carboxy-muconic semialdehyde decarboxylase
MRLFAVLVVGLSIASAPVAAQPKSAGAPDPRLVEDLVVANHVLADLGVVDGFGHVSARHDKDPNRYLMSRSMAPALVKPDDVLEYDLDSVAVDGKGRALFLERFIHGEIYKARPDVKAVVHSHSPSVIPFGVSKTRLQPIYHMSSFMGVDVPVFEIRDVAGPASDLLVRDAPLGVALAKALADKTVVLMRGTRVLGGPIGDGPRQPRGARTLVRAPREARDQTSAVAFFRVRRFGLASASAAGSTTGSAAGAAAAVFPRFSYASRTVEEIRPRVDTSSPLAVAHSRMAAVSSRGRPAPVEVRVDIRGRDPAAGPPARRALPMNGAKASRSAAACFSFRSIS